MNNHVAFALAHPVYNPRRQIVAGHFWRDGRLAFALTVNLGME